MKYLLILTLALTTTFAFSQSHLGIKFGSPTISTQSTSKDFYDRDSGSLYSLDYLSTKTSYSYGISIYHDIGENWWLSTDVLYRKKEVNFNVADSQFGRSTNPYSDKFNEVSFPVAAGIRRNNFKIGLGPIFTYKVKSELSLTSMEGFSSNERKLNTGFQFMIGYIIKDRIHIDLKRELNFNGSADEYYFDHKQLKLKTMPNTFSISAAIYL